MKTLIVSVDRDDDLGRKAGVSGPVVGREAVLAAATRLALADPEDSDANCLFAAVSTYDDLVAETTVEGMEYELAALTGHKQVGPRSDAVIVAQFERLLSEIRPDRLIVVSDGAEDEQLLPLLESRIRIDSVRRIVVTQAVHLKGIYYLLVRLFEDERLQKKFILPSSIALIVFGFAFALGKVDLAVGAGLVTLGTFLLIHAMHWEARLARAGKEFYGGLRTGKVSFFTTVLALGLIGFGALRAYVDLHHAPDPTNDHIAQAATDPLLFTLLFLQVSLWWVIAGLILNILGRALDELIRERKTRSVYWRLSFSLLALGFILEGLLWGAILGRIRTPISTISTDTAVYGPLLLGLAIIAIGNLSFRFVRDAMREDGVPDAGSSAKPATRAPAAPPADPPRPRRQGG